MVVPWISHISPYDGDSWYAGMRFWIGWHRSRYPNFVVVVVLCVFRFVIFVVQYAHLSTGDCGWLPFWSLGSKCE